MATGGAACAVDRAPEEEAAESAASRDGGGSAACPRCGLPVPGDAPMGLCPHCLADGAGGALAGSFDLSEGPEGDEELRPISDASLGSAAPGSFVGKYEILERITIRARAVVYRARERAREGRGPGKEVALKILRATGNEDVDFLLNEVGVVSRLHHPNIVPVLEVAEHEGWPYFTMEFLHGGSLADRIHRFGGDCRRAAELVETVARAVEYAHSQQVLHRDLNPSNILLDDAGVPHVADFGVAKLLGEEGLLRTDVIVGTPRYMAPEQWLGDTEARSDVWALGVILYELLTFQVPFAGDTPHDIFAEAAATVPVEPWRIDRRIDRTIGRICLRCLEKDPGHRYASPGLLADDLRRYLNHEPIAGLPWAVRAWIWYLRHPRVVAVIVAVLAFLVISIVGALWTARQEFRVKRANERDAGRVSSIYAAEAVLHDLQRLAVVVHEVAEDGERRSRILRDGFVNDKGKPAFPLWFALDSHGVVTAEFADPKRSSIVERNFGGRDYFLGAAALGRGGVHSTHVSSVHKSVTNGLYEFSISAPLFDEGVWAGVLVAVATTQAKLPSPAEDDDERTAVLAGPWDPCDHDPAVPPVAPPDPPRYLLLRHPTLKRPGDSVWLDDPRVAAFGRARQREGESLGRPWWEGASEPTTMTIEDYQDPVGATDPQYAGRRMASLAAVGGTGFVVLTQNNQSDVLLPEERLVTQTLRWAALAFVFSAMLVFIGTAPRPRPSRARRSVPPSK